MATRLAAIKRRFVIGYGHRSSGIVLHDKLNEKLGAQSDYFCAGRGRRRDKFGLLRSLPAIHPRLTYGLL